MNRWTDPRWYGKLAKYTWYLLWEHDLMKSASSIAFNSLLAAIPLMYLTLTLCLYLLPDMSGSGAAGVGNLTAAQLQSALAAFFPPSIYGVVTEALKDMQSNPPSGLFSFMLPMALWFSSSAFVDIIDALNKIYGVQEKRSFLVLRLIAMAMALIQAALIFLCIVVVLAWPQVEVWLELDAGHALLASGLEWMGLFLMLVISYALAYRVGPDSSPRSKWVTPGSIFGATMFLMFSWAFREYLEHYANYHRWYGSFDGIIALMVWFWIISMVFLIAAKLNRLIDDAGNPDDIIKTLRQRRNKK